MQLNLANVICPILGNNPHIVEITIEGKIKLDLCHETILVAESLCNHKSLKKLSFFPKTARVIISRTVFLLQTLNLCPASFQKLLMFLDIEQCVCIDLTDESRAFRDCSQCGASAAGLMTTFSKVVEQSKQLEHLNITNCQISSGGMETLASGLCDKSHLEFVSVVMNENDEQLFSRLITLFSIPNFQTLRLTNLSLYTAKTRQAFVFLRHSHHVKSSHCILHSHLLHFIVGMFTVPLMYRRVEIHQAELTIDHAAQMQKLICNHQTVTSLSLAECILTSAFVNALSKSVETTLTLKSLTLPYNRFVDCSMIQLLNAVCLSRLEELNLSINIYQENRTLSITELGKSLQAIIENNKCLQTLCVRGCGLTVLRCISNGLIANSTLQVLNLSNSFRSVFVLTEEEQKYCTTIIDEILASPTLKDLNMTAFYFDETVMSHLATGLTINKMLQVLTLDSLWLPFSLSRNSWDYDECLTSPMWIILFEALKQNTTIHTLSIQDNDIGREGVTALKNLLDINNSITTLKVSRRITDCRKDLDDLAAKLPSLVLI